jgi:hypothetical protein
MKLISVFKMINDMCKNTTYKITDQAGNAYQVEGPPIGVYIKEYSHLELTIFEELLLIFTRKYNEKLINISRNTSMGVNQ